MNNEEKILSMLETLVTKVDNLEQEVQDVKQEVKDVKNRVIVIEEDHGRKLGAIFDSYSQLYDISGEIRSDVAFLKSREIKHDAAISWFTQDRKAN